MTDAPRPEKTLPPPLGWCATILTRPVPPAWHLHRAVPDLLARGSALAWLLAVTFTLLPFTRRTP